MMARWTRERDEMMARWTRERDALRAEAEAERVVAAAALDDVKEAERARADAVSFADARRVEATAARAAAETARADAERAVLRGREEVDAELRLLRDAHETRVRDAARALEEERRRDAETNAHAVAAAEAGVTAALDEARDAVEAARAETRDAAAAFSLTLTLRAWWMSAKHEGERARRDAVAAAANPKRRALKRETLRRWLEASPKPNDARRARRARVNRLRLVAWLAWRREAPAREARARAAETFARARRSSRRRATLREGVRAWIAATRYATHLRTAHARVLAKTRERRLKATIAAWRAWRRVAAGFQRATETFVARRREARLRAIVKTWFTRLCWRRHENNLVNAAKRRFWTFKSARILRGWYAVARSLYVDRAVTASYVRRKRLATLRRCLGAWRTLADEEIRAANRDVKASKHHATRLARAFVSAWREEASRARARGARARVADAKATRRVLGVVRFRTLSRATSAWAEEAAEARRRRVAVRRCVSRRDRRATSRAFDAWARARGAAADLTEMVGRMYRRVTSRRLRQASFYAWRRRADAHAAAWVLAGRVREGSSRFEG